MYKLTDFKKDKIAAEVDFQYSRSSGPGGQKVNKTETRVELFWNFGDSPLFTDEQKQRLYNKCSNRINKQGYLQFYSDQFRSRDRNKAECLSHLYEAIEKALTKPKPRKKTKPSRASVEKRIKEKKKNSDKKKMRQKWD